MAAHGHAAGQELFGAALEYGIRALENLGIVDPRFWNRKRVLITGHTGFKGAWLSLWLAHLGADVSGYALPCPTSPSMFNLVNIAGLVQSEIGDISDLEHLSGFIQQTRPEILFHLAAQPLVHSSYRDPVGTFRTNVMGTVHVLEAARHVDSLRALVIVTSDKCYENVGTRSAYRETDRVGGHDPYSSSKACAELVAAAYNKSFFRTVPNNRVRTATARAGNVIGGGDWAEDRLVPDCMRALLFNGAITLRNPLATRPWQHVLDPLAGYLLLASKLFHEEETSDTYNFGPLHDDAQPVGSIVKRILDRWGENGSIQIESGPNLHEAQYLRLDSTLAREHLGWKPQWTLDHAVDMVVDWYKSYRCGSDMQRITLHQIGTFCASPVQIAPPGGKLFDDSGGSTL